jgi:hypothetical protein
LFETPTSIYEKEGGRTELKIAQAKSWNERNVAAKGSYQPTLQGFIVLIPE